MQSYLQYRAIGRQIQRQWQENNRGLSTRIVFDDTISPTTVADQSSTSFIDVESNLRQNLSVDESLEKTCGELDDRFRGIEVRQDLDNTKVFVVGLDDSNDPLNVRKWSLIKRIRCTANVGIIALVVGAAAAIDSASIPEAASDFGVSQTVEALATGLFLCGFGVGSLIAGPLSETVGRNPVYMGSLILYMLFIIGAGLSKSIEAQLICRFLAGFCGESPLSTVGGSISDIWEPLDRLIAFPIFASIGSMGPITGALLGGFIADSSVSWRWTEWTALIMSAVLLLSLFLFQPETYSPILLKWKAAQMRHITGDLRYKAPVEIEDHPKFTKRMLTALSRPFLMISSEPVIILWTIYLSVVYAILFGFLDGYAYVFGDTYGTSQGITGLIFLGMGVGIVIGSVVMTPLVFSWAKRRLSRIQQEQSEARLPSEFFLWYAMLGAPAIPISLFWMGWTASRDISIWSPILASVVFGLGNLSVFISTCLYLIDSYETYAASALTMNTLVRYMVSGGMVEASIPMYENLGVHWALTILGVIASICTIVPYVFYRYGSWIRSKSRLAKNY
ncbi:major facilitator superfamily domain-containing protein [Xylogone sp. PMI_703]|nr:major facilitator superfamily domain-containing protein [Xylogone sp. PMI_703]